MDRDRNVSVNTTETEQSQLLPILRLCWSQLKANWGWFVLSVIFCVALAYLYQQRKPRIYSRQAVMLIEDGGGASGVSGASRRSSGNVNTLLELNGVSVGNNMVNEVFILTSYRLMQRVVDSLQLDIDYTMQRSLHPIALYRERPFEVTFARSAKAPESFKVRINDNHTFTLSDFSFYSDGEPCENPTEITLRPGESKKTPIGTLSLTANAALRDFNAGDEITVSHWPKSLATKIYSAQVSAAEYDKESSLITLTCNDVNAGRAEDILRTLFNTYKQDVVDNKNRVAQNTARFIDERIRLIGEDLGGVENSMAQFKRNNQLVDVQANANIYLTESSAARRQALEVETQLTVARYLMDFLKNSGNNFETIPQLSLSEASFTTLVNDYNKMVMDRNNMVNNSSENTPAVRDADRQLEALRSTLLSSVKNYINTLELQLSRARGNEAALAGRLNTVPEAEKQGLDIKRQQELKSNLYVYLLNKREEVSLQMAISEANVRLVEDPRGSNVPIDPRKNTILLLGLLLGLALPAAILYLRHLLDVTINGRRDLELATSIPIVGDIPRWEGATVGNRLISQAEADAPIVESFRVLRYALNFMRHSAKVFIVTSATPGQGKSFISSNLSYILGVTGKRVLLIDGDIRKRTMTGELGNSKGLTGLLIEEGEIDLDGAILRNAVGNRVDFLPAGKIPPNPSELLMSDRLDEIIDAVRARYDYIVIDATPTLSVSDADILNRVADITLFVLRVGVQHRDFLPELENMYRAKKFRNLCAVINDANSKRGYGNYGYGYGYSYGYGDGKKSRKRIPFFRR